MGYKESNVADQCTHRYLNYFYQKVLLQSWWAKKQQINFPLHTTKNSVYFTSHVCNFYSIFFLEFYILYNKRYKIYIEGWAWSVSHKYIMGCDSMTLQIKPKFHEFFSRGMLPTVHYWPIRDNDMCRSLKFAVEWGNTHADKVNISPPNTSHPFIFTLAMHLAQLFNLFIL